VNSWDETYRNTPPWDIGSPQPAFVGIVEKAELKRGRVLDVGCGTGENAIFLAENGFSVTGLDVARKALQTAKAKAEQKKVKVDFRVGDALSLDFPESSFDSVIDSGLFHTFTDEDRPVFAAEIARVLRDDGLYFMLCFSDKEPTGWGGPRRVSKKEIESTFSHSFRINYVRDALFATRIHSGGGKAYLTSATRRPHAES
jgi:ubiquinone/menaquinone biosynthesis C-methylase UbiE